MENRSQAPQVSTISDQLNELSRKLDRLLGRCTDLKLRNAALEEVQRSLVEKPNTHFEKSRHHRIKTP